VVRAIVTPEQMRRVDAAAIAAGVSLDTLVERAGAAVARAAVSALGGTYGRTVNVIVGRGNNGADGRVAATRLAEQGVRVRLFDAAGCPPSLPRADLVIDAAYGTGLSRPWIAPDVGGAAVLAVDIPSGVDGLTGALLGQPLRADLTVTFAALKPGLLLGPGRSHCGEIRVVDIGVPPTASGDEPSAWLVEQRDVAGWIPRRSPDAHKWHGALRVIAGSPAMTGAAHLLVAAALRCGVGMVHVTRPGIHDARGLPVEAVAVAVPVGADDGCWADQAAEGLGRFHAVTVGPGLGRSAATVASVRKFVSLLDLPLVIDGDGLFALGSLDELPRLPDVCVLTPHEGEFARLIGRAVGPNRIDDARQAAQRSGATVLLKGPTTVVATPNGSVRVITTGDHRLATAGSGDVLTGVIGALMAGGVDAFEAAAAGAWIHGRTVAHAPRAGLIAGDLPGLLPMVMGELDQGDSPAGVVVSAVTSSSEPHR
jgi:ADP-dependent NAD(P)H-hydrate dehydratase / NAD(P)H-hydrate epimerase